MDAERWDWAIGGVALLLRGVLRCVALQRRKETRKETRDLDLLRGLRRDRGAGTGPRNAGGRREACAGWGLFSRLLLWWLSCGEVLRMAVLWARTFVLPSDQRLCQTVRDVCFRAFFPFFFSCSFTSLLPLRAACRRPPSFPTAQHRKKRKERAMSGLLSVLLNELQSLSIEARKKFPDVKDVCDPLSLSALCSSSLLPLCARDAPLS